jgi:NADH pyrophosphatase NudC (nudix superfamily)
LKMSGVSHGRPVMRGLAGAIAALFCFHGNLYFHLFKANQGVVVYKKFERADKPTAWADREKLLIVDAERALAADEAVMPVSEVPLCPRCKRPLDYLEDQQKFWCKKCKRASYVG